MFVSSFRGSYDHPKEDFSETCGKYIQVAASNLPIFHRAVIVVDTPMSSSIRAN